jgi:hypothetical protein
MPANSEKFFSYLLTLIHLEPVDVDDFNYRNLNLDQNLKPLSVNFNQMGYKTLYSIINLAFSAYWFLYFPIIILLVFLATKIPHKYAKVTKFVSNLIEKVLPNTPILFVNETYMLITTSFFLNCLYFKFDTYGNILCSLFTVLLGGISFGFPIFVGIFYSYHIDKIKRKDD